VFNRILNAIRDKVRSRQYVMTLHAEEEMDDDNLSIFDIESGILTGKITERQKDVTSSEAKYVVRGQTLLGDDIFVVGKLGPTGKLVIITVYREY
jgi:hypothetical protein